MRIFTEAARLEEHKHRLDLPQSASVAVLEPHCTADMCSVNYLSINAGKAPYIRERPSMKCFLEVIVH